MEKKSKKILWIALAVLVVLVVGVVLYFRFMPVWASLQVLASLLVGLVAGWLSRLAYEHAGKGSQTPAKNPVSEGFDTESETVKHPINSLKKK